MLLDIPPMWNIGESTDVVYLAHSMHAPWPKVFVQEIADAPR